jgi:hypothetical protein
MSDKPLSKRVNYIIDMRTLITTAEKLNAHKERPDLEKKKEEEKKTCHNLKAAAFKWWDSR